MKKKITYKNLFLIQFNTIDPKNKIDNLRIYIGSSFKVPDTIIITKSKLKRHQIIINIEITC